MVAQVLLIVSIVAFGAGAIIAVIEINAAKKQIAKYSAALQALPDQEGAEREYAAISQSLRKQQESYEIESRRLSDFVRTLQRTASLEQARLEEDTHNKKMQWEGEIEQAEEEAKKRIGEINRQAEALASKASRKLSVAKRDLQDANKFISDNSGVLSAFEHGFIPRIFTFDEPQQYRDAIRTREADIRDLIKSQEVCQAKPLDLLRDTKANHRFSKSMIKLVTQAFNSACSEICSEITPTNFLKKSEKLDNSFERLNKAVDEYRVSISDKYRQKQQEILKLTFERKLKVKAQREHEREIREQICEEERAEKERQAALEKAEKERKLAEQAYDRAEREIQARLATVASGNEQERQELLEELDIVKRELAEAKAKAERAKSQAELTKTGHVYVLSNIGTMGERVYKVGMTRRLDPMDRVKELSDASVPFFFDCHGMVVTENAPELEKALHKELSEYRVNKVNFRKEFFKCDLETITQARVKHNGSVPDEFIYEPLAEEYYASQGYEENEEVSARVLQLSS